MANYYIDLSASASGIGIESIPYTFAQAKTILEALSGDQSGDSYFWKRGSSATGSLAIGGAQNFKFLAYGTGARPKLSTGGGVSICCAISNSNNVMLRGIWFDGGTTAALQILGGSTTCDNTEIYDCEFSAEGTVVGNGLTLYGANTAALATGCKVRGNYAHDCYHNGYEFSYMDGLEVSENSAVDCDSKAFEYWHQCINVVQERNYSDNCSFHIWCADQTGNHGPMVFRNEIGVNCKSRGCAFETVDGLTASNMSLHIKESTESGRKGIYFNLCTSISFYKNIILMYPSSNVNSDHTMNFNDAASVLEYTGDRNVFAPVTSAGVLTTLRIRSVEDTTTYDLTTWGVATSQDLNSVYDDPEMTDPENGDVILSATSPALYGSIGAADGYSLEDYDRNARPGGIDAGALQYLRTPFVTSGFKVK